MQAYFHSEWREWAAVDSMVRLVARRGSPLAPMERAALDMVRAELHGDPHGQLRAARELARVAPGSVEAEVHVAHMAVGLNRPREALVALDGVDPERGVLLVVPFYFNRRTASLHALGEHREELAAARRGHARFPNRSTVLLTLARALG